MPRMVFEEAAVMRPHRVAKVSRVQYKGSFCPLAPQ
jgi:hypothetical protein